MAIQVKGKDVSGNVNFTDSEVEQVQAHQEVAETFNMRTDIESVELLRDKHNTAIMEGRFDPTSFFADFKMIWNVRKMDYDLYTSEHVPIYDRQAPKNRKDINKLNNKIHVPFYNLIVNQGVQYLNANPPIYDYDNSKQLKKEMESYQQDLLDDPDNVDINNFDDEPLQLIEFNEIVNDLKLNTKIIEISKHMGATGVGYLHIDVFAKENRFASEDGLGLVTKLKSQVIKPWYGEVMEDSAVILKPRWSKSNQLFFIMEVWTRDEVMTYTSKAYSEVTSIFSDITSMNFELAHFQGEVVDEPITLENPLGFVPVIEFKNNEERMSDFFVVEDMINALDNTMSDQQNEIEQFRLAYMFLKGKGMSREVAEEILSQSGIITSNDESGDAKYLTKELNVEFNQFHMNALLDNIYTHSNTINFNGDAFSGNSSGESRQWQIKPLEDRGKIKEQFMVEGLQDFARIVEGFMEMPTSGYGTSLFDSSKMTFKFRPSIPVDIVYMADAISKLKGVVSNRTLASQVQFVDNGAIESRQLQIEKTSDMTTEYQIAKLTQKAQAEAFPDDEPQDKGEDLDGDKPSNGRDDSETKGNGK